LAKIGSVLNSAKLGLLSRNNYCTISRHHPMSMSNLIVSTQDYGISLKAAFLQHRILHIERLTFYRYCRHHCCSDSSYAHFCFRVRTQRRQRQCLFISVLSPPVLFEVGRKRSTFVLVFYTVSTVLQPERKIGNRDIRPEIRRSVLDPLGL
jgi:hypothetical protein